MKYIEAPEEWDGHGRAVFLAGGITDCPDWQTEMVEMMDGSDLVVLNPRRKDFPISDPDAAQAQITWEHHYLRRAGVISFWFPKETLCPIVLYELGAWSMTGKPLVVGVEPGYQREADVRIQTRLARPGLVIVDQLEAVAARVIATPGRPGLPEQDCSSGYCAWDPIAGVAHTCPGKEGEL